MTKEVSDRIESSLMTMNVTSCKRIKRKLHGDGRNGKNRRGAAAVEFALVSTLLFVLFFTSLELCRVAMIRHTADNAVYEACRVGIIPGATAIEVQDQARAIMATLGVSNVDVNVSPGSIDRDTDEITVTVAIPLDANSYIPAGFTAGKTVTRVLTLRREGIR
jgi:Flp pilus assembly protein TadG